MEQNLPATTSDIATLRQNWGILAERKLALTEALRNKTLELQVKPKEETIPVLEAWLGDYRKNYKQLQDMRLGSDFYAALKKIGEDLMKFEKEYATNTNPQYLEFEKKWLDLRRQAADTAKQEQAKAAETAAFKTHVQNQYISIPAKWKQDALISINEVYQNCLETGEAKEGKDFAYKVVKEIPLPKVEKFTGTLLTQEEKTSIYQTTGYAAPRKADLLIWAQDVIEGVFSAFEHDLASGQKGDLSAEAQKLAQDAEKEVAVNNLMATVAPVIVPEGKPIKKEMVVVVEETEYFAQHVMAHFLKVWPVEYLSNRKWSTLSIEQMAKALGKHATEHGETFSNPTLELKEVVK